MIRIYIILLFENFMGYIIYVMIYNFGIFLLVIVKVIGFSNVICYVDKIFMYNCGI